MSWPKVLVLAGAIVAGGWGWVYLPVDDEPATAMELCA